MSFGGQDIGSVRSTIGLDDSGFKRGLDQARAALQQFGTQVQQLSGPLGNLTRAFEQEAVATRTLTAAKQQGIAIERELATAKIRLAEITAGESKIVQDVSAKYNLLSNARRAELVTVREQIAEQERLAVSTAKAAAAQERATAAAQRNLGRNLQGAGRALTGAVTTPIVGAAFAAGYAGQQVQQAEAGIRAGTGLTGERLQAVQESFRRIAPQVSQPLKQVGDAVAELERRTGLTGAALEKLAVSELNLQRITRSGTAIFKDTAQLFTAWNVATADQIPTLDELLRASQASGIGVGKLAESVTRFAPSMRAAGLSLADSITLFAQFEKAGIPPERIVAAINVALGKLAKAGAPDAGKALQDVLARIQNLKNPTEALNEAVRLFNGRVGVQLADALRTGKVNLQALEQQIVHGSDTVQKAAKDTETFSVVWGRMRNAVEIALAPLGKAILQFVLLAAQALRPAVEWLGRLLEAFGKLSPGVQAFILGAVAVAAAIGPIIAGVGSLITTFTTLRAAWVGVTTVFGATEALVAVPLLLNPITLALAALSAVAVAFATNWHGVTDSFRAGLGVLERLPGNLAAGYGAVGAFRRSMEESAAANQEPGSNVSGGGGTVPTPQFGGPDEYQRAQSKGFGLPGGVPALSAAARQAMYGKGRAAKKTPEEREEEQLAQRMEKDARIRTLLARGETVEVARMAGEYTHLSLARLRAAIASEEETNKAIQAAQSRKAYGKDLEKLNAEIRRLKAGHDAEAGGLDALKEKYPGLTRAQLQHLFASQQYERHLQKLHETQKKINDVIRQAAEAFLSQTAATRAGREALALFKDQADKFAAAHPGATAQDFWKSLAPNQQRRAKDLAFQGATGDLDQQINALAEENAALRTGQRNQYTARTVTGQDLAQIRDPSLLRQINRLGTQTDINQQRRSFYDAFNAPRQAENQLIGNIDQQNQRLQEQFTALTGKSTAARETMQKFGLILRDLPKDTQAAVRGFLQMNRAMDFFTNFANGVQSVFNNMFTNLAEHGFKGFFKSVIQGFQQMLQQMAAQYLASELSNLFLNLVGGLFGTTFGGQAAHRQYGGPVAAGRPVWTGEAGPELFIPPSGGSIVPHSAAGMAPITVNMHIQTQDAASFRAPHNQQAIVGDLYRELERARRRGR